MTLYEIIQQLIGKTILSVDQNPDADRGLIIYFTNGDELEFGYSGCEGSTSFNNEPIRELD